MNPEAIQILKDILIKEARELTENDIAFLRARWPYVGKKSRAKFQDTVFAKGKKSADGGKGKLEQPKKPTDENQSTSEVVDEE